MVPKCGVGTLVITFCREERKCFSLVISLSNVSFSKSKLVDQAIPERSSSTFFVWIIIGGAALGALVVYCTSSLEETSLTAKEVGNYKGNVF